MSAVQRGLALVVALLAMVAASGCLSPTLPLPPPDEPEVEQIGVGRYQLSGRIREPGAVFVLNLRTNLVAGTFTRGAYSFPVEARPQDGMQLWYETGGRKSDSVIFEIPAEQPAPDAGSDGPLDATGGADAPGD